MTDEEQKKLERRLRRKAKIIKEEMLEDLQARGLVPKEDRGRAGRKSRKSRKKQSAAIDEDYTCRLTGADTEEYGWQEERGPEYGGRWDGREPEGGGRWDGREPEGGGKEGRGTVFVQMVEDYVELWITRAKLEADIAERGVTVMDYKRGLPVENCSVSARVRVSKQMTTIVQSLGYKDHAVKARRPEVEDDEL